MSGAVDPDRDLDYLHLQDSCPTLPRGGALCGTAPSSVLDALAFVSEELVDHAYSDKVRVLPGDHLSVSELACPAE